ERFEIRRRRIFLQSRCFGGSRERTQYDLAVRCFRQFHETRPQRHFQQRLVGRRVQNALRSRLPQSPDPGERSEEKNLVRTYFLNRFEHRLPRSVDADRMKLTELIRWHKIVEVRSSQRDFFLAGRQINSDQEDSNSAQE